MTTGMKVILLIDDESQQEAANAVCTQLSANSGVYHVTVRSSRVSLDPWLTVPMLSDKNSNTDADADADTGIVTDTNVPAPLLDRKSTRLNSSHRNTSRMPSSA